MKRFVTLLAILLPFTFLTGCVVHVKEKEGDDTYEDDSAHDDGGDTGGETRVVVKKKPAPVRRRVVVHKPAEPAVYWYRNRYRNLPNMGKSYRVFRKVGRRGTLGAGYMVGDVKLRGPGLLYVGAGKGRTVIDGDLDITGNHFVLKGITITGRIKIRGNNNDLSGCELRRPHLVRIKGGGQGNKLP